MREPEENTYTHIRMPEMAKAQNTLDLHVVIFIRIEEVVYDMEPDWGESGFLAV